MLVILSVDDYGRFCLLVTLAILGIGTPFTVALALSGLLGIPLVGVTLTIFSKAVFNELSELLDNCEDIILEGIWFHDLNSTLVIRGIIIKFATKDDESNVNLAEGNVVDLGINRLVKHELAGLGKVLLSVCVPCPCSSLQVNDMNVARLFLLKYKVKASIQIHVVDDG